MTSRRSFCSRATGKEFHFLWGRYEYKFTLGAVQRALDNVIVYRSALQFLLNGDIAWRAAVSGYMRRAQLWVKYKNSFMSKKVRKIIERMRDLKRSAANVLFHGKQTL